MLNQEKINDVRNFLKWRISKLKEINQNGIFDFINSFPVSYDKNLMNVAKSILLYDWFNLPGLENLSELIARRDLVWNEYQKLHDSVDSDYYELAVLILLKD